MNSSEKRSKNVKRNIAFSFLFKAIGIGLSFLLLPLTVNYLTKVEYGVWVTLFSVMNWVNMLDMGIGLGLRNKLAESVAQNDLEATRRYMSTGIAAVMAISGVLLLIFLILVNTFSLQPVYNTVELSEEVLYNATLWTGIFVITTFVLSLINQFYYAWQQAAKTGLISIVNSIIMLAIVYYLTLQPEHNFIYFVYSFGAASIFSRLGFLVDFFRKHREVMPKIKYVHVSCVKAISNLGLKFFVMQVACICLFSSANILITQRLGPENILAYDVVFKVFSVITMAHSMICAPLWNAYTEAYVKKDFLWMQNTVQKMLLLMIPIFAGCVILVFATDFVVAFWLHKDIAIPDYLPSVMGVFVFVSCFNNVWGYFFNGIGKIDLQMYLSIIAAVIVIPLAWWLMGIFGVTGMILAIVITSIFCGSIQCVKARTILNSFEVR